MAFQWNPQAYNEAMKLAGYGLEAATIFVQNTVKETISLPAPRITLTDKTGARYYVAGFKLSNKNWQQSPYAAGSRQVAAQSFKFPKLGPPSPVTVGYRTAPAIKGDPPRKLSGDLRRSIQRELLAPMKLFEGETLPTVGRVGTNLPYARSLEFGRGGHEFLNRVVNKYRPQIEAIVANRI